MTDRDRPLCDLTYVTGYRYGQKCPYPATNLIDTGLNEPFRACGYHAKGWVDGVIYPLDWPLDRQRTFRMNAYRAIGELLDPDDLASALHEYWHTDDAWRSVDRAEDMLAHRHNAEGIIAAYRAVLARRD